MPKESSKQNRDYTFNFCIVGDPWVGKSKLLLRYTDGTYNDNIIGRFGIDFKQKISKIKKKQIKLQIWDTVNLPNTPIHEQLPKRQIIHAVMMVFDVTDQTSFNNIKTQLEEYKKSYPNMPVILVGSKCDDPDKRVVESRDAEELAKKFGIDYTHRT